jgi:ABC-type uncharacterized transport system substrate-binding protein
VNERFSESTLIKLKNFDDKSATKNVNEVRWKNIFFTVFFSFLEDKRRGLKVRLENKPKNLNQFKRKL